MCCNFDTCKCRIIKMIGHCRFCNNDHCLKHRLPEMHKCPNIDMCYEEEFNKNKRYVKNQKCVRLKI